MTQATLPTQTIERTTPEQARQAVAAILSCYPPRNGNSDEAALYVSSLAQVLVGQPLGLVRKMANPVGGLASRCKYMPSVADITAMLVDLNKPPPRDLRVEAEREAIELAKQDRIEHDPADVEDVKAMVDDLIKTLDAKAAVFANPRQKALFERSQCAPGATIKQGDRC